MYNIEDLDSKNIFELRLLAKEFGIQSPTKLKKDELIEKINKIANNIETGELPIKSDVENVVKKEKMVYLS